MDQLDTGYDPVRSVFAALDVDRDGWLTLADLQAALSHVDSPTTLAGIFATLDRHQKRRLSYGLLG